MRFSFDELYADAECENGQVNSSSDTDCDFEGDYTFIGDPSDGIQLKLPKLYHLSKNDGEDEDEDKGFSSGGTVSLEDVVEPEILSMLSNLNIALGKSALPRLTVKDHEKRSVDITLPKDSLPIHTKERKLVDEVKPSVPYPQDEAIESAWDDAIGSVQNMNQSLIRTIKEKKKRVEEERVRKEHEAKKQAEEEKRRKMEMEKRSKEEEQRKLHEQAEKMKMLEEAKKAEAAKQKKEQEELDKNRLQQSKESTNFKEIEQTFLKYKSMIQTIKTEIIEPVKVDAVLKKTLAQHKRKINPKFGQLTNSVSQLNAITSELTQLVDQTKANPLAFKWILNFISKAIVSQAESEARVKPESALPLGRLAVNLLAVYPELKEFLLARLIKKCPFVIGYTCSIETVEGRTRMGWKRQSDNKWEEDISYDERMGGMVTLFAVITRLPLPQTHIQKQAHPFPISWSWRMQARIGNTPNNLLTNTHFVVAACWWEAAAAQLLQAYNFQAAKLLQAISLDLTASVADKKFVGAARLRIISDEFHSTNHVSSFSEMKA
ncbi:unnamed protein product [Kluyveromyces dobzhanskii CBS 2104]|uniref:mRNA export factor GLE1 n=1 Tax=Kluyveromyces dobzhanskii CBS 2104 TaxID=1427455 RepID=A0A0A8L0H5_9SACH|nr:unnamed protein product [Kluyveromyces dobzhanskii CBS 2104]